MKTLAASRSEGGGRRPFESPSVDGRLTLSDVRFVGRNRDSSRERASRFTFRVRVPGRCPGGDHGQPVASAAFPGRPGEEQLRCSAGRPPRTPSDRLPGHEPLFLGPAQGGFDEDGPPSCRGRCFSWPDRDAGSPTRLHPIGAIEKRQGPRLNQKSPVPLVPTMSGWVRSRSLPPSENPGPRSARRRGPPAPRSRTRGTRAGASACLCRRTPDRSSVPCSSCTP